MANSERKISKHYQHLHNLAMAEKLSSGEARDVSPYAVPGIPGLYVLPADWVAGIDAGDFDLADGQLGNWIWSVGVRRPKDNAHPEHKAGEVMASTDARFYQHPDFLCIWLR